MSCRVELDVGTRRQHHVDDVEVVVVGGQASRRRLVEVRRRSSPRRASPTSSTCRWATALATSCGGPCRRPPPSACLGSSLHVEPLGPELVGAGGRVNWRAAGIEHARPPWPADHGAGNTAGSTSAVYGFGQDKDEHRPDVVVGSRPPRAPCAAPARYRRARSPRRGHSRLALPAPCPAFGSVAQRHATGDERLVEHSDQPAGVLLEEQGGEPGHDRCSLGCPVHSRYFPPGGGGRHQHAGGDEVQARG